MPDGDAARWSDLSREEQKIARADLGEESYRSFGAIRQCADGLWQVRGDDEYVPAYFIVSEGSGAYRLLEIRGDARSGCPDDFEPTPDEALPSPSAVPRDR